MDPIKLLLMCTILIHSIPYGRSKGARQKVRPKNKNKDKFPIGIHDNKAKNTPRESWALDMSMHNRTDEELLLAALFRNYDPDARGIYDSDSPVDVEIEFVLLRIHGLDERSMVFTTTGLIITEWTDQRLTWNPADYGNLTDIIVRAEKLWLPELAVMNGADEMIPEFEKIRVMLHYSGRLHWEPGGIFRTTCDIDITFFPFDSQQCQLLIGAWSYHSRKMNITCAMTEIETFDFRLNGEWHVFATKAMRNETILDCCPGHAYAHVVFTLFLRRRHTFYIMNIILPCIMLSILIMVGFYLPPEAGEKISLGISVLLAFTVFLLMVADAIPRTSLSVPLIVVYLTATMLLGAISVCMTVLVLNIHHRSPKRPVPRWLHTTILCYLSRVVCVRTQASNCHSVTRKVYVKSTKKTKTMTSTEGNGNMEDVELVKLTVNTKAEVDRTYTNYSKQKSTCNNTQTSEQDDSDEPPDFARDWHELSYVIDRLFFWLLGTMMVLAGVLILAYPYYTGNVTNHFD